MKDIAEMKARWSVIAFSALVPIFIVPLPWVSVLQAKVILLALFVLVGVLAWALSRALEGVLFIPRSFILASAVLLPVAYAASALWHQSLSSFVGTGVEQNTVVVMTLLSALLLLTTLTSASAFRTLVALVRALFIGSAVLIIFQIIRIVLPGALSLGVLSGSASSLIGSWHDLGIVLGLLVFLSLASLPTPAAEGAWKWLVEGIGALALASLVVVNWQDVWYALALLALLTVLYRMSGSWGRGNSMREIVRSVGAWLALALIAGLCGFGSSFLYAHLPTSLQVVQVEVRPSWQGTFAVGEKVFNGGPALLFGSGPGTFSNSWGLFKPLGVNATNFWNVDFTTGVGLVPTALVEVGALGLLAWGVLVLSLLLSAAHFVRAQKSISPMRGFLFATLGGALYLFGFQIFYTPGLSISVLAFLFLGMLVLAESAERRDPFTVSLARTGRGTAHLFVLLAVSLLVAYAAVMTLRVVVSDTLVSRSVAIYSASQDIGGAGASVHAALSVYPDNTRAERAAVEVGLLQLRQLATSGDSSDTARAKLQEALSQTIQHGLSAVSIDASDYQNWLALAGLYQSLGGAGAQGAYESAKAAYQKAHEANPTNPLPLVSLAQISAAENKPGEALDFLDQALALKGDLPSARFLRSQVEAGSGKFDAAEIDAREAVALVPQDPLGWYNLGVIYYAAGSYQNAAQSLAQAVSLQRDYANALFVLALSLDKSGDRVRARVALQEVVRLNPDNSSVKDMLTNLDAGKPLDAKLPK